MATKPKDFSLRVLGTDYFGGVLNGYPRKLLEWMYGQETT